MVFHYIMYKVGLAQIKCIHSKRITYNEDTLTQYEKCWIRLQHN